MWVFTVASETVKAVAISVLDRPLASRVSTSQFAGRQRVENPLVLRAQRRARGGGPGPALAGSSADDAQRDLGRKQRLPAGRGCARTAAMSISGSVFFSRKPLAPASIASKR